MAEDKRTDAEIAKSAEAYGLPKTYKEAVEEVHEWREATQVDGIFTPASLRRYLVSQGQHHDEHHCREKRVWAVIGGEPEDDSDPEVRELEDAVRVTLQYERDLVSELNASLNAANALLRRWAPLGLIGKDAPLQKDTEKYLGIDE